MPIPNINLIPPAYYLKKKVKVAWAAALLVDVVIAGGLVAFIMNQNAVNADLTQQKTEWQARADKVEQTKTNAQNVLAGATDYTTKTDFVNKVFAANAKWATIFEAIRDYTYPRVTYTSIKPTAGSQIVAMHIKVPGTKAITAQQALNLYWANLLRSPKIISVLPSTMLGYPMNKEGGSASVSVGPPGMAGPGPMMPSPGGPPSPRYMGSPSQIASPATEGSQNFNLMASREAGGVDVGVGVGQGGLTISAATNPMYDFDITAQMKDSVTVPTYGAAAQQTQGGM